jgi:hypothetical protein
MTVVLSEAVLFAGFGSGSLAVTVAVLANVPVGNRKAGGGQRGVCSPSERAEVANKRREVQPDVERPLTDRNIAT